MFELPVERTPDRIDLIRTWVPRIAMSLFFLSFGSQKFTDPYWVGVFATIGFGDWFRYLTGMMQVGGNEGKGRRIYCSVDPGMLQGQRSGARGRRGSNGSPGASPPG